jgi:uncharacterized RDD family membrane protein YckC
MKLNRERLIGITAGVILCGITSSLIVPFSGEGQPSNTLYIVKHLLASVQLNFRGYVSIEDRLPDFLNIGFYALLLVGLLIYCSNQKETRMIRFAFAIIFLDNLISLGISVLSILAAAANPDRDYPFTIFTAVFYTSGLLFLFMSYTVLRYLQKTKTLSVTYHHSEVLPTSFFIESTRTQRFLHLLVDTLVLYLIFPKFAHFLYWFGSGDYSGGNNSALIHYCVILAGRVLYYFIMESIWSATPAKLLTQTRITDEQGQRVNALNIFGRTLSRFIPFNALSFFGNRGWHDSMSNTYVLRETYSEEVRFGESAIPSSV